MGFASHLNTFKTMSIFMDYASGKRYVSENETVCVLLGGARESRVSEREKASVCVCV